MTVLKSPKRKGDEFERALATYFNGRLFNGVGRVSRAPLSGGGFTSLNSGGSDLIGLPELFVEAKRTERINVHAAIAQAIRNRELRQSPDLPIVITRRNRQKLADSLVILRLDDFVEIYKPYLKSRGYT